jgi:Protein of unknown function (DUF3025)
MTAPLAHPLQRMYLAQTNGLLVLPDLDYLNQRAADCDIRTGGGHPLQFADPNDDADYERRAFDTGIVATRPDNWHDAFNALVWLTFPQTKSALNRAHLNARSKEVVGEAETHRQRSKVGDMLTQFDECGLLVVGCSTIAIELWQAICRHEWVEVFVHRRAELMNSIRFIVFGHGSLDSLRAPFVGLCGKAIYVGTDVATFDAIAAGDLSGVDLNLSRRVTSTNWANGLFNSSDDSLPAVANELQRESSLTVLTSPKKNLQPIPLLGIPRATPENEHTDYYLDTRQFRPLRRQ